MDRRKTIKALALGGLSTSLLTQACKPGADGTKEGTTQPEAKKPAFAIDRMEEEKAHFDKISKETFFTPDEMAAITLLADIIIPADEVSGSASQAGVPEFIEFIVKDMPEHQTPMRGGLRWLNVLCATRYGTPFKDCTPAQHKMVVDEIAYPEKAKPEMRPGVAFFNLMRNLTATGFYTSPMGIKDLGYVGNKPNQWNGVPSDVLQQYGLAYTEKELQECISFS